MRGWGAEANTVDRSEFDPHQRRVSQPHQHQYQNQNQYPHAPHNPQPFDHPTRHSLPLNPDSNSDLKREGFQRHVSGSSSSGFSGGPGPGLGSAPGMSGYQGVGGGSDMRGSGDRQSGGWGSGGRGSFYGSQPGRGHGRAGGRGGGRQFSDSRKGYAGEGRPRSEMAGVLHAVELGRQGSQRGGGGGWGEGEIVDEAVSTSGSARGSTGDRGKGEEYVEPTMSTALEKPITSLQNQSEDSQGSERSDQEQEDGRTPRNGHINLPTKTENPDDLWRTDTLIGNASESPQPPSSISQPPQSWSNASPLARNPYNSRSRQPYHGNGAHRRGEEYKAVIRSKIENLEDEEKPAFVKAKEKVQGDAGLGAGAGAGPAAAREAKAETKKRDEDGEVAAGEEKKIEESAGIWGVLGPADEQSGRGPMESNSKLFGPASLAAQSLETEHPGHLQLGHGVPPSQHRLQGDVARRISDSGWGSRARGPKRVGSGRGGRRGSKGEVRESGLGEGPQASPAQQKENIGQSVQPEEDTPRQTDTLLDGEDANASIAVEPTERIDDTPPSSSPAELNQSQQAPGPGFSAHTRLLTMAVNELRPAVQEVSAQQLKRVGHKQDRADYVADWKRSQANEPTADSKDWEEKSIASEAPSRAPSRKGRGATKAPPVSDQNGIPVVVALPRPGQRRLVESGRKLARDDETKVTKQQAEGSVASGMSGYEAQPDEDSATIIRGTSFDGIWDTVPIDEEDASSAKNMDANETGSTRSARSEKKIVVRLPTPKSSPLPSLAGSDHVPSPLIKMAVLAESQQQQQQQQVEDASSDPGNLQIQEGNNTQNLEDSILGLHSLATAAVTPPEDLKPSDTVKIPADVLESFDAPLGVHARVRSGESQTIYSGRPSTYPSSEVHQVAGTTANPVHRSRSSLGSLPLEKVIIPLDDLSDVESESQETVDASVRKETVPLPVVSPVPPYNYSHVSPPIPYFTRQPGIRSAVIPERRLPEMSPEVSRRSPLTYPNEMSLQQPNGTSRYHSRAHPAPTKWELKIESMLHSVSARQNQNDHTNQEIRSLRQEVTALQQHLQEARHRVYAAQSAVAEKQSHVEQLSTRIGENARTAQMYEGSLAARNADLAYCRGRIEHLESILLANQKFIADLQTKVAEMSQPKKGDKTSEESRIRGNLDRILEQQRQTLDHGKKFEQNLSVTMQKLQESLDSAKETGSDQVRQFESQAASLKERGLQLDVREANFQLTQVESERDYYKRLAKDLHDQLKESNSKPRTVFDIDPDRPGFIETTYNSDFAASSLDRLIGPSRFGMPNTPPKSTLDLRELR